MKKLLNTLFVTSPDVFLSLDGENVVANREKAILARYPLHTISDIIMFTYSGASPALMGKCTEMGIGFTLCSMNGKYLGRIVGENNGNVLLRREQYRIADNDYKSCLIARNMILGKIYNCRKNLERAKRDHQLVIGDCLNASSETLKAYTRTVAFEENIIKLRGIESVAAKTYFEVINHLILQNKSAFSFQKRTRRPPTDPVNAMLSFAYSLLANECTSALESVGLDAYVGFLHSDRPGRPSLALDLMEELRPCIADRFVLSMINNRIVSEKDFEQEESGAVNLTDSARRVFLKKWHDRRQETIIHPFMKEKVQWGMIPYIQSLLLARYIRQDLDEYPPFFWR